LKDDVTYSQAGDGDVSTMDIYQMVWMIAHHHPGPIVVDIPVEASFIRSTRDTCLTDNTAIWPVAFAAGCPDTLFQCQHLGLLNGIVERRLRMNDCGVCGNANVLST